ncbi:hypothetical protein WICMUC_004047 [Wickerhamomyces mucosus]|uniref:Ribonuclease T2-like n=1 Tax=Wickerhamomyces mucosus TaxID=1378264 RepID=A0A9P8PJM3_9ASCO|nr:hypothetical protein WICMUC_004047 [Wickerhamomyces mucosus]
MKPINSKSITILSIIIIPVWSFYISYLYELGLKSWDSIVTRITPEIQIPLGLEKDLELQNNPIESITPSNLKSTTTTTLTSIIHESSSNFKFPGVYPKDLSCPTDLPLSCSNHTNVENLCCFEHPGGIVLQTQFWDYNPGIGPNDSFTIHGTWGDNCDGTFDQFCDSSMKISSVKSILQNFPNGQSLLDYMEIYWKDYKGLDENLWLHEFNKHATCYSTLKSKCYGDNYIDNQNVYDFFQISINLFEKVPTFNWLKSEGIIPSNFKTYTKLEILNALTKNFGYQPFISCDSNNALNQVWYYHIVKGSILNENFIPIDSLNPSNCKSTGIKFLPKSYQPKRPIITKTHTSPNSSPTDKIGELGFIKLSNLPGCLIKNGKWYVSGTCANYKLIKLSTGSYNLKTNAGWCTIDNSNEFICSRFIKTPFEFNLDEDDKISANGQNIWNSNKIPQRFHQESINLGKGGNIEFSIKFIKH